MAHSKISDKDYIFGFLDRMTEKERNNLKFNLDQNVQLSTPNKPIPQSGFG